MLAMVQSPISCPRPVLEVCMVLLSFGTSSKINFKWAGHHLVHQHRGGQGGDVLDTRVVVVYINNCR